MDEKNIWEFYENLNEIVYVADMDSYDLIYLNSRARKLYGVEASEKLKGRKCYQVVGGCSKPCAVCCNSQLRSGHFLESKHYNPLLERLFALKDTMIERNGRRYHFELAVDLSSHDQQKLEYADNDVMIREGMQVLLSESMPEQSIAALLEYLGQFLNSERIFIFEETEEGSFCNTYEWCADGAVSQMKQLQRLPFEAIEPWYQKFQDHEGIVVRNTEALQVENPAIYEYLRPLNIHSFVLYPLINKNKLIGFYGADNPPMELLNNVSAVFRITGYFIISLLQRRETIKHLEHLCYSDQLTKIGNRHALNSYIASLDPEQSVGVLYCDVMGLKRVNDTQGHKAGDELLVRAGECLKTEFKDYGLFRIGGDEFLVLCAGIQKQELLDKVNTLKAGMSQRKAFMALGWVWHPGGKGGLDLDRLMVEADNQMYAEKRAYYASENPQ